MTASSGVPATTADERVSARADIETAVFDILAGTERGIPAARIVDEVLVPELVKLRKQRDARDREVRRWQSLTAQTCPRSVHRDWWHDGPDLLPCPWCQIDVAHRVEQGDT